MNHLLVRPCFLGVCNDPLLLVGTMYLNQNVTFPKYSFVFTSKSTRRFISGYVLYNYMLARDVDYIYKYFINYFTQCFISRTTITYVSIRDVLSFCFI